MRTLMQRTAAIVVALALGAGVASAQTTPGVGLVALRAECLNNPNNYSYTDPVSTTSRTLTEWYNGGFDAIVAIILNEKRAAVSIARTDVTSKEIREVIDLLDLSTNAAGAQAAWVQSFLGSSEPIQLRRWNGSTFVNLRVYNNLLNVMTNTNGSETRLRQLAVRQGSRAEQLFGDGITVTGNDVAYSRPFSARVIP